MTYTPAQLETVTQHYLIAADWADKPEDTNPRTTKESKLIAREFCRDFIEAAENAGGLFTMAMNIEEYGYRAKRDGVAPNDACEAAFGHDIYLTCAGHGVGFWDRKELDADGLGDALTAVVDSLQVAVADFYGGWMHITRWNRNTQTHYKGIKAG